MIDAVLIDIDNTIIDFVTTKRNAIKRAIKEMQLRGLKISKEEAEKKIMEVYSESRHGMEDKKVFQKFLKKLGYVEKNQEYFRILYSGVNGYRQERSKGWIVYEGVYETLKNIKESGLKLGVVTDALNEKAYLRLTNTQLDFYFDVIVTRSISKEYKPSGRPFLIALNKLKVKPQNAIFVGDNPKRDIAGAKAVGLITVYASYGTTDKGTILFNHENIKADHVINDIRELSDILENLK